METVHNIVERAKEVVGIGHEHEHEQPADSKNKQTSTNEQDIDPGHQTIMEAVKDTISTVIEKTKEITGLGQHADQDQQEQQTPDQSGSNQKQDHTTGVWEQANNLGKNIRRMSLEIKDSVAQKIGQFTDGGQQSQESDDQHLPKKMRNWNESLAKVQEQHDNTPLHPKSAKQGNNNNEEEGQSEDEGKNESGEGFQQKLVQAKDTVVQKGMELKDMVGQKASGFAESAKQMSTQVFNKLQGEGEGMNQISDESKDANEQQQQQEQHTGLVAAVSGIMHSTIETGKDLIEKAKDTISNLTTGTVTTDESVLQDKVEPVNNNDRTSPNVADKQDQKKPGLLDRAATKVEEWTEGGLGDISVVDPTKKNKKSMTTPGQPKENITDQPASEENILSA